MNARVRKRVISFGLLWGLVLAVFPAMVAFDDPFSLSPFLVSAFASSALSGAAGALLAGRWASGADSLSRDKRPGVLLTVSAGALQGLVFCVLVSVSVWVLLAINISGFSVGTPGGVLNLLRNPAIFEMSGIAARAVFAYSI
ncbi:MAG: hypothetical protein ACRDSJ_02370, partial [Rubrobacteraceae bacterium]